MVSNFVSLLEIQEWWEIPCIAHFCSLFSSTFDLPDIDIEDLEQLLLDTTDAERNSNTLPELIIRFLRGFCIYKNYKNQITTSNYQMYLRRLFRKKCDKLYLENHFDSDVDFTSLPVRNKLLILYTLCHLRLEPENHNVGEVFNNLEADSIRVQPLGFDSKKSSYWYFYGTRLYREDTKEGSDETVWQVICFTEQDWLNLSNKFKKSRQPEEKELYTILTENFLPKLRVLFNEQEKQRRVKLLKSRNSTRIQLNVLKRQQQKDEETKAKEEAESTAAAAVISSIQEKPDEANSRYSRRFSRRCSQSNTSDSILSTTNSSIKPTTTNTSEFLNRREIFCLTPEEHSSSSVDQKSEEFTKQTTSSVEGEADKENFSMAPATNTLKITGRQTNNSLSSISENIFLPVPDGGSKVNNIKGAPTTTTTSSTSAVDTKGKKIKKSKKEKVPAEVVSPVPKKAKKEKEEMVGEDTLQIGMHKILSHVKSHRDAWPFMDPVDEEIAPRYYSIIRRPMDLQKMEEKLDNGDYNKFSDFRNDFKLIVNNCRLYNGHHNEYTEMVNNLQEAFEKGTSKFLDHASEDEDDDLGFPDVKMNVFREKNSKKKSANKKSSAPQSEDEEFNQLEPKESLSANETKELITEKSKKPKKSKKTKKKSPSESEKSDVESDSSEKDVKPSKTDESLISSSKKKFFKNFAKKRKKYLNEDDKDDSDEEVLQKKKKAKSGEPNKPKSKKEKEYSFTESDNSENETAFKVDLHKKYRMIADEEKELEAKKREESDFQLASMFMDKYDLIKQRRSRDSGKSSSSTTVSSPQKREPSPKRKEKPIEKEKPKPKQKKKETENKEKSKKPPKPPPVKEKVEPPKVDKDFEKEFDKLKSKTTEVEEKEVKKEIPEKPIIIPPTLPQKPKKAISVPVSQTIAPPPPLAAPTAPPPHKTTNINDLNYEAEQTLKDISRWLEHTPKLPSELSSASNSPLRYTNLIDEIDSKIAATNGDDFTRSLVDETKKNETVSTQEHEDDDKPNTIISEFISDVSSSKNSDENSLFTVITSPSSSMPGKYKPPTKKEPSSTQFLSNPPLPPHVKAQQKKEAKYKSLKEKLAGLTQPNKKKVERTTDRLQPGKTKGNLLQNIHKPTEEVIHLGVTAKIKEPTTSSGGLAVDQKEDSSPKLSLGTVLDSGFDVLTSETPALGSLTPDENNDKKEAEAPKECAKTTQATKPTPNLNAWFKAFGGVAPKKKKVDEPPATPRPASPPAQPVISSIQPTQQQRQRKASTGSTVSERSSYSQDPDSPRIGIDDRYGPYNSAYTSPLGASPIMVSPKTDDIKTPPHSQPYQSSHQSLSSQPGPQNPLNGGSIKVGFYQDTTTKSSPEKSCSPREVPLSPYPQYSQNMYGQSSSAAPSPNVSSSEMSANSPMSPYKCSSYNVAASKTPENCNMSGGAGVYVEQQPDQTQYKQPRSQESDYNLSMSPATAPNTPQTNNSNSQSPYHQNSHSPYQPHSPYQQQSGSVTSPQQAPQQKIENSPQPQHSPYHQQHLSPVAGNGNYYQGSVQQQTNSPIQQQPQQQQAQVQNSFYNQITGGNIMESKWDQPAQPQQQQPRVENQSTPQPLQQTPQPQQQPAVNFSSLFNQEHQTASYENLNLSTKQPEKQQLTARLPAANDAAKSTSMFDSFLNIGSIFNRNQDNLFPQQQTMQQKQATVHQQPTHHQPQQQSQPQQQPQQNQPIQPQQQAVPSEFRSTNTLVDHQQLNPFTASYKTPFGNPATSLLDPSPHLRHPLLFDDPSVFYEKNSTPTPPNAHQLFPTSYLQQQTTNQQVHQQQQQLQNQFQTLPVTTAVPAKPKKTRKNAKATVQPTNTPAPQINQQQYYGHPSAAAGFQAYAGMKSSPTNVNASNAATTMSSATEAIKSAVAAASAFNFAPSATTFGGLYPTDNTSYSLDDHFSRVAAVANSANPYFSLTAGSSATTIEKVNTGASDNSNTPNTAPTNPYTSFLHQSSARTSSPYHPATSPFINSQMDTNSQFYQQHMVRHMMMNQGFLRPGAGAGYPHPQPPDFRTAPTLGMPKPYDVNNPRWF